MRDYKAALTEATIDTMIALPLNFIINWVILTIAFGLQWNATLTTIVATSIFTAVAIFRKTYVRLHFQKKDK
jgi:hypothetical protein